MSLVDCLLTELARGPVAAALAAREAVARDIDAAAAIADDGALDISVRVAALLALALVAQDQSDGVPAVAIDALQDDVLVDAVLAAGASSAITGLLSAAGERADEQLRRYLALRLSAAGATGIHVAALLLCTGERDGAVRAAVPALAMALRAGDERAPVSLALASIALDWLATDRGFVEQLALSLPPDVRVQLARAVRTLVAGEHPLLHLLAVH